MHTTLPTLLTTTILLLTTPTLAIPIGNPTSESSLVHDLTTSVLHNVTEAHNITENTTHNTTTTGTTLDLTDIPECDLGAEKCAELAQLVGKPEGVNEKIFWAELFSGIASKVGGHRV
jgi:hypothetical protein